MSPAEAAKEASSRASAWIAVSPNMIDVLGWHEDLCGACALGRKCGEYQEIIAEYGAGPYGASVFYPDA